MKKYFVEVKVGIYMDEMDDENSTETAAEIADNLVYEAVYKYWNADIVTTTEEAVELHPSTLPEEVLDAYATYGLDRIIANGVH